MKAMVLETFGCDLHLREVEEPRPSETEIVLRVEACGICSTDPQDRQRRAGRRGHAPPRPGPRDRGRGRGGGRCGAGTSRVGDRGVVYFLVTCGDCEMCRTGRENLCFATRRLGFELPGGYARLVKLPAWNFCPFETDLSWEEMAILPDAIAAPYHALNGLAGLGMGDRLLIVGAGGLGVHAVQIAVGKGAVVAVADVSDDALGLARSHGAELTINPAGEDPRERIREFTDGKGVDRVLEGVGKEETMRWALPSLKRGGTCVVMGYDAARPVPISLADMHNNQWTVVGAKISTRQELREVVRLVERGRIKPVVSRRLPLSKANEGLAAIRRRESLGRTVLTVSEG